MSSLSTISINRPVLAIVMSITILIFGVIGFNFLGVREYPSVDPPIITVSTNYVGANADIIESQLTEPLEEAVNGIAGIKTITSVSRDGRSTVTVEFELEIDMEAAANDVRDKVAGAISRLPPDIDPPIVSKADADSNPIVFLTISSKKRSLLELTALAENVFKERMQTIAGVSEVRIWGSKRYSMRLWMDQSRLAAYNLTPVDVFNAVNSENVELPSGSVEGTYTELSVRTMGRLVSVNDFDNLIISQDGNNIVRFQDIGYAELGPENERTALKRDGIPMVGIVLIPQPGSNSIEIADEFYNRLNQLKMDVPEDIELTVGFDTTRYIRDSISEVQQTILIAFLLVVGIIFLFLRDWRTTIIPVLTIPISLVGAFFIMYTAGFSINVLTLLGIVLAIGLVVDDTIVVLENIYTKIEGGMNTIEAGIQGTKEIFFAVISTTIALVSVFLPVIFLQGLTGRLFREFGFVVAGAVVISSFVALTLTPMLSSKILKKRERKPFFYRITEPAFVWLNNSYQASLKSFMTVRWVAFLIIAAFGGLIYGIGSILPSELAPLEDRNDFRIVITGPEGATFEYMDEYLDKLNVLTKEEVPENEFIITVTSPGFGSTSSVNSGFIRVVLVEGTERERSQQQIVDDFTPKVMQETEARSFLTQQPTIGGRRGGLPVQYIIQASSLEKLEAILPDFVAEAEADPAFNFIDLDLKFNKPEIKIEIDREKARTAGVSVRDVAQTLQLGFSGQRFGYFIMDGKQHQIIGQMNRENRNDPLDLKSLYVKNRFDELVQIDNLVTISETSTPPQLFRFNRYVSATVSANLAPGVSLGDGIKAMDRIKEKVLDDSYSTSLTGTSSDYAESSSSLIFAFMFALVLIYLVLSAQFESFKDPFIIMFTVPLAIGGAVFTLWYFNESLNIFSQIGIIMLIGLVTKNGILIVEFANQRKARGMDIMESITGAATARFRPILMTSLSTILGILPIALALGAGSESRVSMGIAVIGGLIFSTILTLYVIPAIYSYFTSKESRQARF